MRRALAGSACVAIVVAVGSSCGPVAPPPPPLAPMNACPEHDCARYVQPGLTPAGCSGGICTSNTPIDFDLVVSLPESSFFAPGTTIAVPWRTLVDAPPTQRCPKFLPSGALCRRLPQVVSAQGLLLVSRGVAESCTGSDLGNASNTSLPVQVKYRPLWRPDGDPLKGTFVEALAVGIPVLPVRSRLGATSFAPGPFDSEGTLWNALLAPGIYERTVTPIDPRFPPAVVTQSFVGLPGIIVNDQDVRGNVDSPGDPARHSLQVKRLDGRLDGFTTYLRDTTTARRLSSLGTLAGSASTVVLNTFIPITPALDIVVAPPSDAPIPTLVDPILAAHSQSLGTESFPALPPPVMVSGTIESPGARPTPIAADLVIDSASIVTTVAKDPAQPHMRYSTFARAGADGHYAVALPPGTYDVYVQPASTAYGAISTQLKIQPARAGEPAVAAGQTLVAAVRGTIRGVAVVADRRPLAGAVVEAHVAASLRGKLDPRRWPRTVTTMTDASGAFALSVDPGTYDVTVMPAGGTNLPWVTSASNDVKAGAALGLATTVVPAPIAYELVLHDPNDNDIADAIVRAFAPRASSAPASAPGAPPPEMEIGSFSTDGAGHVSLFLVPPS